MKTVISYLLPLVMFSLGWVTGSVTSSPKQKQPEPEPVQLQFQVTYPELRSVYSVDQILNRSRLNE